MDSSRVSRCVRVGVDGVSRWGLVEGDSVLDLPDGPWGGPPPTGESLGKLEDLELLAPAVPTKIICVGRNYVAHAAEHGVEVPKAPLLFSKPPSSVLDPGREIVLPELSNQVEHEGELALVIGTRCRQVAEEDAWRHVLGITCANDVTARDIQRAEKQWTRAKGFDTFCPLGPWIVAGLGESHVADLEVVCRLNGEVRQRGRTSEMVFPPAFLIAYISAVMTLEPGDVILTGTPAGVSPLALGDVVEVEVEGVGLLSNPVT